MLPKGKLHKEEKVRDHSSCLSLFKAVFICRRCIGHTWEIPWPWAIELWSMWPMGPIEKPAIKKAWIIWTLFIMNITVNLNQYKYPTHAIWALMGMNHKELTYVEYRAVPGVFQNIDPPPPSPPSDVSSPSTPRAHSPGGEGGGGQYFGRRQP
jgi:hypothetical protein